MRVELAQYKRFAGYPEACRLKLQHDFYARLKVFQQIQTLPDSTPTFFLGQRINRLDKLLVQIGDGWAERAGARARKACGEGISV